MMRRLLVLAVLVVAAAPSAAQSIILVRHAERADAGAKPTKMAGPADPDLSAEGHARARRLATMLGQAGV